jgi:hypothetical protein
MNHACDAPVYRSQFAGPFFLAWLTTLTRSVCPESFISQAQTLSQVRNCLFEPAALDLQILLGGVHILWLCNPAAHHINDQLSKLARAIYA